VGDAGAGPESGQQQKQDKASAQRQHHGLCPIPSGIRGVAGD
jgi:hypothetical protein